MIKQKGKNSNPKIYSKYRFIIITLSLISLFCLSLIFTLISLNNTIKNERNKCVRKVFELSFYNSCYKTAHKKTKDDEVIHKYCLCMANKMVESINWDKETFIYSPNIKYSNVEYAYKTVTKHGKACIKEAKSQK